MGGKLDIAIAAPSPGQSFAVPQATPSCHIEIRSEGNTHALVKIPELNTEEAFGSRIAVEYKTSRVSFPLGQMTRPSHPTYEYCRRDKFWETNDPLIRRTAERIRHSSRNFNEFLSNTYAWVRDSIRLQDPQPARHGAARAIRERIGDCDEMSDLFIALCRAEKVACRRVVGLFYHGDRGEKRPFEWHAWAEVQTDVNAWIPFDPALGFLASLSEMHLARVCMGRRSDYPTRKLDWRSRPVRPPVLNDDDVESITLLPS